MLQLKRKLEFRGHVYFQAVRPQLLLNALNWLKKHNPLYKDITIDIGNIAKSMTTLQSCEDNLDSDINGKDDIASIAKSMTTLQSREDNLDSDTNGKDLTGVES